MSPQPKTFGELRQSQWSEERFANRGVRQELRENLLCKMEKGEPLFPGVHGYDDTVIPQIVNAVLSRHHFILLGLRGQAKSRIIRGLMAFMDSHIPYVEGCEIHDNPYRPLCRPCRERVAAEGNATPIAWLSRDHRYVEKLATPDVTIADMIGDVDPIKAAKGGHHLADELTIHYGLLPRANRGIFAINELPDLAGKIQVGLFNIMQEGDVQIKGYPVRLALDVLLVFTANPEDYTARGKIITPLKDRIGSEIRTHYPATVAEGMSITAQEVLDQPRRQAARGSARLHSRDRGRSGVSGARGQARRPAFGSEPAAADQHAGKRAEQRRAARGTQPRFGGGGAGCGCVLRDSRDDRQIRTGIRRRDARRGEHRPRIDSRGGRENLQQIFYQLEFSAGGAVVRDWRRIKGPANASSAEVLDTVEEDSGAIRAYPAAWCEGRRTIAAIQAPAPQNLFLRDLWAHKRISRSEERGFYRRRKPSA